MSAQRQKTEKAMPEIKAHRKIFRVFLKNNALIPHAGFGTSGPGSVNKLTKPTPSFQLSDRESAWKQLVF
jgi:hypothetical protein